MRAYPIGFMYNKVVYGFVSTPYNHFAIGKLGLLYSFGENTSGELGVNTGTTIALSPTSVAGGRSFKSIDSFNRTIIGLEGGTNLAYTWGSNTNGQIGDNTTSNRSSPTSVVGNRSFKMVSAGMGSCYGIEYSTGNIYSWGANNYGELGDNSTTPRSSPVSVVGGRSFSYISAGQYFVLAIEGSTGNVYSWGNNSFGQLGDGSLTSRSSPVLVQGARSFNILSAGTISSVALDSSGKAFSWGGNSYGSLGDGTSTSRSSPVSVLGGKSFSYINMGDAVCCAIEKGSNLAYQWGTLTSQVTSPTSLSGNQSFKLLYKTKGCDSYSGITTNGFIYTWGKVRYYGNGYSSTLQASPISATPSATPSNITAGEAFHAIFGGFAYGWGNNTKGTVGDGTTTPRLGPTSVIGGRSFNQIASKSLHTIAVQSNTGNIYSWGLNAYGQLGDNTTTDRSSPVSVVGGKSFKFINAGWWQVSIAIDGSNKAYAWGNNSSGQLGDNTTSDRSSPTSVVGGRNFSKVAAAAYSCYGIDGSTGNMYSWGDNTYGQLGDNTITNKSSPISVLGGRSFSNLAANYGSVYALEGSTGYMYSWGDNTYGQLGDGTKISRSSPVSVLGGRSYVKLFANDYYCYAIDGATGYLYTWGRNYYANGTTSYGGMLGDNSIVNRSSPTLVLSGKSINGAGAGALRGLAYDQTNFKIYTWGNNQYGELLSSYVEIQTSPVSLGVKESFFP